MTDTRIKTNQPDWFEVAARLVKRANNERTTRQQTTPEMIEALHLAALDEDTRRSTRDQDWITQRKCENAATEDALNAAVLAGLIGIDAAEAATVEAAHVEANREDADRTRTPAYSASRFYVDDPTPRTYETTMAALELANLEPLYTAARAAIRAEQNRQAAIDAFIPGDARPMNGEALEAYVAGILEDQDTTNPRTALIVALASAATCRVDWSDVAAQLMEADEISEDDLEAAAAFMDKYNQTQETNNRTDSGDPPTQAP